MNNVIFGSGVIGLLAKAMLGPAWRVIPFHRSRFFSFNPALDDNFIIRDERTDEFIRDLNGLDAVVPITYNRAWSISGQLVRTWDKDLCDQWLYKVFGAQVPPQSKVYYKDRLNLLIYRVRISELYKSLLDNYLETLREESVKGPVTEVGDHYFVRNNQREEFDNIVSTIPLDKLNLLMGIKSAVLPTKDLHYYHIHTNSLDFEGCNQVFVVDEVFKFYRAIMVAVDRYVFYCHEVLEQPGIYFMSIMSHFEILDGTSIVGALPMGPVPKQDGYEKRGIFNVGSYAQWDWCMDVGSCIQRLQKLSQRGFQPTQKVSL